MYLYKWYVILLSFVAGYSGKDQKIHLKFYNNDTIKIILGQHTKKLNEKT